MAKKVHLQRSLAPRLLEPGPVTLVTSMYRSVENVMTAAWMMPVSMDPPLVGVAIYPGRLTHEYIGKSEFFAINFPTAELVEAVHRCGIESGREGDKFERANLTRVDALEIDAPLIDECVAHIECGVIARTAFGDHDLFIGEPLAIQALDEAFNERWLVDVDAGRVLHHLRANYYASLSRPYEVVLREDEE
jgi:flavin reductase (DIM6/NTAB) family NADH-FMN oxidoreductase RutF